MRSKIHSATVSEANLAYVGSIASDPGSGVIAMNGAATHLITAGEKVTLVDGQNRFDSDLTQRPATSLDAANHATVA